VRLARPATGRVLRAPPAACLVSRTPLAARLVLPRAPAAGGSPAPPGRFPGAPPSRGRRSRPHPDPQGPSHRFSGDGVYWPTRACLARPPPVTRVDRVFLLLQLGRRRALQLRQLDEVVGGVPRRLIAAVEAPVEDALSHGRVDVKRRGDLISSSSFSLFFSFLPPNFTAFTHKYIYFAFQSFLGECCMLWHPSAKDRALCPSDVVASLHLARFANFVIILLSECPPVVLEL
jgi:hypothetical protein